MFFTSDNTRGASERVLSAIVAANGGALPSYGADEITARVAQRFAAIFEHEVEVFLVATGTAANALAIASMVPPYGSLLTHRESHAIEDECGAPEFFTQGAKLIGLAGTGGKLSPQTLSAYWDEIPEGTNHPPVRGVSISQATEFGLVYRPEEIAALGRTARSLGLHLHMDGARFANALVALGTTPAAITWRAGVDVLSFGATKNGCLLAEAVIFFNRELARDFAFRRKRAGQTLSKHRLASAQFDAYLSDDHWLDLARHANAMAARLAGGLTAQGYRLAWPCEANEVFVILDEADETRLRAAGARFYLWSVRSLPETTALAPGERVARLVTSFATQETEVEAFLAAARRHV